MADSVLETVPLGFPWVTVDPFLFCAYHNDRYPRGNGSMGVTQEHLRGRNLGMDFDLKDGFRMYHGHPVPGFPQHPHRGFETVTLVRKGYCDHADSLGAAARFGAGDAQWLTTGGGIVHSEMFPLLSDDEENHLELFQIWLNLPSTSKMVDAHFSILWSHDIPTIEQQDENGRLSAVTLIAGRLGEHQAPAPPPHSWAADPNHDVAIWAIRLDPGARFVLPKTDPRSNRALYFFEGGRLLVDERPFDQHAVLLVKPDADLELEAGEEPVQLLMLQGRPIAQPVAHHGPFVMNTRAELLQAFEDYQRTGFGGWPWPENGPAHGKTRTRFARHADGKVEEFPLVEPTQAKALDRSG